MNDHHDPTEERIRRARRARAEETALTPDASNPSAVETATTTSVPDTTSTWPAGPDDSGDVLGVSTAQLEAGPADTATASFILSKVGDDGALAPGTATITVVSPDGGDHWFVEGVETPDLGVELVERNGDADGLRVSDFGDAFEGTGLLWIDDEGPTIVSLGSSSSDHFSVVVPWDGEAPVRVRLETGGALENEVPSVHALAVEPSAPVTDVRVTRVADDDVLNVRTGPGVADAIAFTLAPAATGWANARFLTVWRAVEAGTPLAAAMGRQVPACSCRPSATTFPPTRPSLPLIRPARRSAGSGCSPMRRRRSRRSTTCSTTPRSTISTLSPVATIRAGSSVAAPCASAWASGTATPATRSSRSVPTPGRSPCFATSPGIRRSTTATT